MNKKNKNKGFSLIELIIAIAILVILTGLLAPQFMKYIEKSREAKDMQAMDTVYSSVQAALANEGAYTVMLEETEKNADGTEKIYTKALSAILEDKSDAFEVELAGLLGSVSTELNSKKATADGEICIAVKYKEGKEPIKVKDEAGKEETINIEVFGGFEVMVYCGNGSAEKIPGLQTIGSSIDVDEVTPAKKD